MTSDSADLARIADGIGERWEVLNNAYKRYPYGVVLFPVIDTCLELRACHARAPEAIDRVVVHRHPLMRERTDRPHVETGRSEYVDMLKAGSIDPTKVVRLALQNAASVAGLWSRPRRWWPKSPRRNPIGRCNLAAA